MDDNLLMEYLYRKDFYYSNECIAQRNNLLRNKKPDELDYLENIIALAKYRVFLEIERDLCMLMHGCYPCKGSGCELHKMKAKEYKSV